MSRKTDPACFIFKICFATNSSNLFTYDTIRCAETFKCVRKPTNSRLSLTHRANKPSLQISHIGLAESTERAVNVQLRVLVEVILAPEHLLT